MAYVYCRKCNWQQDDFWDLDGYTPFREDLVQWWRDLLFQDRVHMDASWFTEAGIEPDGQYPGESPFADGRKVVAHILRKKADVIEGMIYRTWEDCKSSGNKCPKCGTGLTVD